MCGLWLLLYYFITVVGFLVDTKKKKIKKLRDSVKIIIIMNILIME